MPVTNLKIRLLEKGLTQRQISNQTGINEAVFSMICNGRYLPDSGQRYLIAAALDAEPDQLFNDYQIVKKLG